MVSLLLNKLKGWPFNYLNCNLLGIGYIKKKNTSDQMIQINYSMFCIISHISELWFYKFWPTEVCRDHQSMFTMDFLQLLIPWQPFSLENFHSFWNSN